MIVIVECIPVIHPPGVVSTPVVLVLLHHVLIHDTDSKCDQPTNWLEHVSDVLFILRMLNWLNSLP